MNLTSARSLCLHFVASLGAGLEVTGFLPQKPEALQDQQSMCSELRVQVFALPHYPYLQAEAPCAGIREHI